MKKIACFLAFCVILASANVVRGDMFVSSVDTDPAFPTEDDSIIYSIYGWLSTTCDTVGFDKVLKYDESGYNYIDIYLTHVIDSGYCVQIVTNFVENVHLGRLAAGIYRVKVIVTHYDYSESLDVYTTIEVDWPLEVSTGSNDVGESVAEGALTEFSLSQNCPNPFNPITVIEYALPRDARIKLTVYNALGQRVRTLIDGHQCAGYKRIVWDSRDDDGDEVASGIYFYRIEAGELTQSKKMVILK